MGRFPPRILWVLVFAIFLALPDLTNAPRGAFPNQPMAAHLVNEGKPARRYEVSGVRHQVLAEPFDLGVSLPALDILPGKDEGAGVDERSSLFGMQSQDEFVPGPSLRRAIALGDVVCHAE